MLTKGEKVTIPQEKPCILLEGAGTKLTSVEWDGHEDTASSTTFTTMAENIIVKGITFKNTYNDPYDLSMVNLKQAVAVGVLGDKTVFFNCSFLGVQDTLWDAYGRHFFQNCYIQGGVDFIFGTGQSIYEGCTLRYSYGDYATSYNYGYITANGRRSADDPSGFVFRGCSVIGESKAYLGRAWNAFSRVYFVDSFLSDVVLPEGWWAWNNVGHEENITFVEANNKGPGADTSNRVPWLKKLNGATIGQLPNISFIDKGGWIQRLPIAY
ncbi:hypothetical protein FH972_005768 [Carpinus fangiana]|uniref:pectinesterase n=1 Tax=Carpinus fangiana TaxID=176857 RepID=A0A5N6QQM1_9ROSI|nr:hypothetical protein FH972_005768 [Carpinus fangiana]